MEYFFAWKLRIYDFYFCWINVQDNNGIYFRRPVTSVWSIQTGNPNQRTGFEPPTQPSVPYPPNKLFTFEWSSNIISPFYHLPVDLLDCGFLVQILPARRGLIMPILHFFHGISPRSAVHFIQNITKLTPSLTSGHNAQRPPL